MGFLERSLVHRMELSSTNLKKQHNGGVKHHDESSVEKHSTVRDLEEQPNPDRRDASTTCWASFSREDLVRLKDVVIKYDAICAIEVIRSGKDPMVIHSVEIVTTGGRVCCSGDDAQAILEQVFAYNVTPIRRAAERRPGVCLNSLVGSRSNSR